MKKKIKESYGIALFKPVKNAGDKLKLLLVKKRCTYHYCLFVHGNYNVSDTERIKNMFNQMTACEKAYILGGNFDEIWYKMWLTHPLCPRSVKDFYQGDPSITIADEYFNQCEKKYIELYSTGKIKKLIGGTSSISGIWEMPKGKRLSHKFDGINETPMEAAIREFHEEVHINPEIYKFISQEPIKFTIEDDNVTYNTYVYLCECMDLNWEPSISFERYSYFTEIDDIKWFSCGAISDINTTQKQKSLLLLQYKVLSEKFRRFKRY